MKKQLLVGSLLSLAVAAFIAVAPATAQAAEYEEYAGQQEVVTTQQFVARGQKFDASTNAEYVADVNSVTFYKAKSLKDGYRKLATLLKKCDYNTIVLGPWSQRKAYWNMQLEQVYNHFFEYEYGTGYLPPNCYYQMGGATYCVMQWGIPSGSAINVAKAKKAMAAAGSAANKFIKKNIKKSMSDKQKLQKTHDYLCKKATYTEAVKTITSQAELNNYANSHPYVFTAYGCLVNGDCVCQGYAAAFSLIARKMGIQCLGMAGTGGSAYSQGSHAWNMVQIKKKITYVDVTWDDYDGAYGKEYTRDYFMVSAKKMKSYQGAMHKWNASDFTSKFFTWAKGL